MPTLRFVGLLAMLPAVMIGTQTPIESQAERQILAAESARTAAKRSGDAARLEQLLTRDFIKINRYGRLLGRRQAIALARNPNYATGDVQLRIYDGGAVVTGRESDEGEAPATVRFLRVWVREGSGWLELADQGTIVSSAPAEARLKQQPPSAVDRVVAAAPGADANHVADAAEASAAAAREVRQAERAYRDAERIDDVTVLSHVRAPDFRLVDRLGTVIPRDAVRSITKAVYDDDFGVRVHGNLAVVIGSVLTTNLTNGATDRTRYSTVWVNLGGQWQAVAEQQTPLA